MIFKSISNPAKMLSTFWHEFLALQHIAPEFDITVVSDSASFESKSVHSLSSSHASAVELTASHVLALLSCVETATSNSDGILILISLKLNTDPTIV